MIIRYIDKKMAHRILCTARDLEKIIRNGIKRNNISVIQVSISPFYASKVIYTLAAGYKWNLFRMALFF